ncbi:MAG: hypothetical protein U1F83_05730 [Verrucomicrobiota bacterium]
MSGDKPNLASGVQMEMDRGQNTGGDAIKWPLPGADTVYVRFWSSFPRTTSIAITSSGWGEPADEQGLGLRQGGVETGRNLLDRHEPWFAWGRNLPPGEVNLYTYYLDMAIDPKMNKYWGNGFFPPGPGKGQAAGPSRVLPLLDTWQCWEFMIQANTAPEKADGKQAMW